MNTSLISRHNAIKPYSREHHFGLLFCWKIREGLKNNTEPERILRYVDWFWKNHLLPHFEAEEKILFPILPKENELLQQALNEHKELRNLFENCTYEQLQIIEKKLNNHIRFEERILFNAIQQVADESQFKTMELHQKHSTSDDWEDEFWIIKN